MKFVLAQAMILISAFQSLSAQPLVTQEKDVSVDARLIVSEGRPEIKFEIGNKSNRSIPLYRNSLPWVNRVGALSIRAYRADPELSDIAIVGKSHDLVGNVDLLPGESKAGSVDLCSRIPLLDEASRKFAVIILWVYTPRSPDKNDLGPRSGAFSLREPTRCKKKAT